MLKLMKLIMYRIINNKAFLITYLVLMPIVIGIAIYFTHSVSYNMRIGIVGSVEVVKNDEVNYIYLDDVPNTSQLVLNEYDAILIQDGDNMKIQSTKGEEFEQALTLFVSGEITTLQDTTNQRGTATNMIGFLMMVVLLLGCQIYEYYYHERNGINKRILSTSFECYEYMLSHFTVVFMFLFVPATVVVCGTILIFDIALSIAMWQFVLVLLLLCFFATSFGLWLNALSKRPEESLLFGNMFAIAGSIISGGFVAVTNNQVFTFFAQFLPQKQIMSLLESLEKGMTPPYLGIAYVIGISIIMMIFAIVIEKKKLPNR